MCTTTAALTFSDLSTAHRTDWKSTAPDYRTAVPGLNLEAKCSKAACASRRDGKLVVLAVGHVDNQPLAELLCDRTCPSVSHAALAVVVSLRKRPSDAKTSRVQCGAEVNPTDIKTLAFSNCTWEYTGLLAPSPGLLPHFLASSLRHSLPRSSLDALLISLPQSPLRHVGLLDRTSG